VVLLVVTGMVAIRLAAARPLVARRLEVDLAAARPLVARRLAVDLAAARSLVARRLAAWVELRLTFQERAHHTLYKNDLRGTTYCHIERRR